MKRQGRSMVYRLLAWGALAGVLLCGVSCGTDQSDTIPNRVTIRTNPEVEAEILVDGELLGTTPHSMQNVRPGPMLVQIRKDGYRDEWKSIVLPEQGEAEYAIDIEQITGYVSINSEPPGATVTLSDGEVLGETPILRATLPLGEYSYTVAHENHESQTDTIEVKRESLYKFAYKLKPNNASLVVFSVPTGANLWLNNQIQPESTPARLSVAPGTYTVTVHAKGYVMAEEVVTLAPDSEHRVDLRMKAGNAPPGMLLIPAGEFLMGADEGSPDERPGRQVHVDAFYIDKYEVTNEQYKAVNSSHTFEQGQENFPVRGVTWLEATEYANRVGKRLPTEAEWEKAARGTDGREYPWGGIFEATLCNSREAGKEKTVEVGSYLKGASPYGVMDMAGNVYEWVADWYNPYPGNTTVDKNYGQVYRVLRGGSYRTGAYDVRCMRRSYARQDAEQEDYGFRCVADVTKTGN